MSQTRAPPLPKPETIQAVTEAPAPRSAPIARRAAAAPDASAVLQLRKKRRPRAHERAANRIMSRLGGGSDTTSPTAAVAGAFLSKGLRAAAGPAGSLRNKLMNRLYASGEPGPKASLGALIGGHIKDSLRQRLATSDLGRAYAMAKGPWQAARRRRDIGERRAAGAGLRAARAQAREDDDQPQRDPPAPLIQPPSPEAPVDLSPTPPLSPLNVSMTASVRADPPGADHGTPDLEAKEDR